MKKLTFWLTTSFLILVTGMSNAQQLRVLSYNIRFDNPGDSLDAWPHRKDYLIRQIAFYAPDVIGTQEGLVHQLEAMDAGLPGYAFFGKGRDRGDRSGEFSAVFYNTARLELEQEGMFWLSATPEVPSRGWDAALNRICTYGLFRMVESGRRFYLFNTHFDHRGEQARQESVRLILEKIAAINTEGLPVVLTGDLNLEPDSAPIRDLAGQMDDSRTLAGDRAYGPEGTFNGFDCTVPSTRRIDYIFSSPGDFRVLKQAALSETTGRGFPSDHFPVWAELEFAAGH